MNPVVAIQPQVDGVAFLMKSGVLRLQVCSDSIVHVLYSPTSSPPSHPDPVVIRTNWPATKFAMQTNDDEVTLSTAQLKIVVTRKDGAITYRDLTGKQLVQEATRKLTPVKVNGEDTYRAESFVNIYGSHEGLYGLGQHQGASGTIAANPSTSPRTTPTSPCPFLCRATAMAFSGTTIPAAVSTTASPIISTLALKSPTSSTTTFSTAPSLDKVIAAYRELTGQAPMFGKWAYGFWQCKNRYKSQEEILGVCPQISRTAHSRRQYRAGLVLVESQGRIRFQQELSRS